MDKPVRVIWREKSPPLSRVDEIARRDLTGGKYSFIFESSRCHGLNETKAQTIKEWVRDQGLEIYQEMEQTFSEIPKHLKLTGDRETDERFFEFFFTACYDLDKFRKFLMDTPSRYEEMNLDEEILDGIRHDDVQLMKFSFKLLSSGPDRLKDLSAGGLDG